VVPLPAEKDFSVKIAFLFICVLLSAVTVVHAKDTPNRSDDNGIVWGEVINGLQLGISPPVKMSETFEIDGFEGPILEKGSLNVTIHLRNVGSSNKRFLPSVWDCLAMGDAGAVLASKLTLTPEQGDDSLTVSYRGNNHLRLLEKSDRKSDRLSKAPRDNAKGASGFQVDLAMGREHQIELAAGDTVWPEWVKISLNDDDKNALWQLNEKSSELRPGKYRIQAALVIDQQASEWKGMLTSGSLDVEVPPQATKKIPE
jgi:hypothetical protein